MRLALSNENDVNFFNLETLVPDRFWGSGSQINFSDENSMILCILKMMDTNYLSSKLYKLLN